MGHLTTPVYRGVSLTQGRAREAQSCGMQPAAGYGLYAPDGVCVLSCGRGCDDSIWAHEHQEDWTLDPGSALLTLAAQDSVFVPAVKTRPVNRNTNAAACAQQGQVNWKMELSMVGN